MELIVYKNFNYYVIYNGDQLVEEGEFKNLQTLQMRYKFIKVLSPDRYLIEER